MDEDDGFCANIVCCIVLVCVVVMSIDMHVFAMILMVFLSSIAMCAICVVCKHVVDDIIDVYDRYMFTVWLENYARQCAVVVPQHQPETVVVIQNPDTLSVGKPSSTDNSPV